MSTRPGVSAFRGIQFGRQVHAAANPQGFGAATAATIYMLGTLQLTPQTEFYNPREERNSRIETHRVVPVARHGEMRFESSLQFQRAPHWFSMFMGDPGGLVSQNVAVRTAPTDSGASVVSELKDSAGTAITPSATIPEIARYKFAPDPDKLLVPTIWTIEYGDNYQYYEMQDSFARNVSLRFDMNNAVMLSGDLFGKFPASVDRTTGIDQPLVHDAVSQFTDVYVGDVDSTNLAAFHTTGTPQLNGIDYAGELIASGETGHVAALAAMRKTGLAQSINLTLPTGIEMTRYSSGSLEFTDYGQMYRTIAMDITLRHSADGKIEFDKYVSDAERRRLFRLVTKGPEIWSREADAGNSITAAGPFHHFVAFDMTMLYADSPQFFTEQGGDDLFTMRASGYHEPDSNWNRDIVIYAQTNRPNLDSDDTY